MEMNEIKRFLQSKFQKRKGLSTLQYVRGKNMVTRPDRVTDKKWDKIWDKKWEADCGKYQDQSSLYTYFFYFSLFAASEPRLIIILLL